MNEFIINNTNFVVLWGGLWQISVAVNLFGGKLTKIKVTNKDYNLLYIYIIFIFNKGYFKESPSHYFCG